MLTDDALQQVALDHRLHHEAEAEAERLALHGRGLRPRRTRRPPVPDRLERLRVARRDALQHGYVVVSLWLRR